MLVYPDFGLDKPIGYQPAVAIRQGLPYRKLYKEGIVPLIGYLSERYLYT